jgi:hypothetical protein
MISVVFKFKLVCLFFLLLYLNGFGQSESNILLQNKILLKNLCQFSSVTDAGSDLGIDFIVFKTEKTEDAINLGFGAAFKAFGNIIVPADTAFGYGVEIKNKYLIFRRGVKSTYHNLQNVYSQFKYGMYDNNGQLILDFKYDYIGSVLVPLPESMLVVEQGKTFQIFNTETSRLEKKLYNKNNCWHDGYSYHEGGAYACQTQVYKQLNLKRFIPTVNVIEPMNDKVQIHKDSVSAYLETKESQRLSKTYHFIEPLHLLRKELFFVAAATINPHTYVLLDKYGKEITSIDTYSPSYNESYIELERNTQYYFIETKKVIKVPENYIPFCTCYAKQGFLGFKHLDTKKKLFIDKFGNALYENEL